MADDIMGGSEDRGLDISDEALEARGFEADPATADPASELEIPADDENDAPVEGEGVVDNGDEPDPNTEEPAGDGEPPAADPPAEWQMPEKYAGKSAEEIARLAAESESYHGNKLNELNQQLQQITAAQQAQAAELAAWEAAQATAHIDPEAALAGLDPVQSYNTALQLLDGGAADPGLVNRVIAETREVDPDLAFEMARDFDRRIMRAEAAQEVAKVRAEVQPIQQQAFVQAAQAASAEFMSSEADAAAYQQDIAEIVKQNPNLLGDRSPAAIKSGLTQALVQARGADITRSAAYQQQLRAEKAAAQVEQGGAPKQPALSEVERIRQEVFTAKDPADALFA